MSIVMYYYDLILIVTIVLRFFPWAVGGAHCDCDSIYCPIDLLKHALNFFVIQYTTGLMKNSFGRHHGVHS